MKRQPVIAPPAGVACTYSVTDWSDRSTHWCHGEVVDSMERDGQRYLRVRSGDGELAWRLAEHVRVEGWAS